MEIPRRHLFPRAFGQRPRLFRAQVRQLVFRQPGQGRHVLGIAAQGLPPVAVRPDRGIAVLLGVHAHQVSVLGGAQRVQRRVVRDRGRHLPRRAGVRPHIAQQRPAAPVAQCEALRLSLQREAEDRLRPRLHGVFPSVDGQDRVSERHGGLKEQLPVVNGGGRLRAGAQRRADGPHGIPQLGELPALVGHQPGKVRLVQRVAAGHQLGVGAVRVGERLFPAAGELAVRPGEHLFAHADRMVRHVHDAALPALVIAAEEIVLRFRAEVGGGLARIPMPGDIRAVPQADAVVHAAGHGVGVHVFPVIELHVVHVRREDQPVPLVDRHGRVFPPEEGMPPRGPVIHLHPGVEARLARRQAHAHHALRPGQRLVLAHPHGHRAVRLLFHLLFHGDVHGHEGAGPVVAGPVELAPAGDPAAQHADQGRLDDVLLVEKIIACALIQGGIDPAAELGHQLQAQVLVFQRDHPEGPLRAVLPVHPHDHAAGVGIPAGALVHPVFREHGQLLRLREPVGGDQTPFIRHFYFFHRSPPHRKAAR